MDKQQLDPVAIILSDAYLATWAYSRSFHDDYERPPTVLARVHHLRSVAQVGFENDERYELSNEYLEFGRIAFTDLGTDQSYLLKSQSAVAIEHSTKQVAMFDSTKYLKTDVVMVVYRFHKDGIDLLVAGARHRANRKRLEVSGTPNYVATWPYVSSDGLPPFDQGTYIDPFGDLGELDIDDEGETSAE